tara:strand:- start:9008 stop:13117 length:4110 start_codon:yes stop_codon:yes gene_type:complete
MPSTYTVNLGIEKPATGEQSGTWGDTVNENSNILDEAINGIVSITLASAGSSGSPNQIAITNGSSSTGRNKWIEFADGGDLGASAYVELIPNDAEKICFIRNSLSASQSVFLFQGTYSASNDLEIAAGTDVVVKFSGTGTGSTVVNINANLKVDGIVATTADINGGTIDATVIGGSTAAAVTGTTVVANTSVNIAGDGATVTGIKDEDNMASNSAVKLATQQSIKAYVDAQVATVDTLSEVLAIGNTSGSTDINMDAAQKVQFRDAAIYLNSSVDGQLDIVADTEIQITATTIDINGAINASGEIIAASLDISGNVDVDGTIEFDALSGTGAVAVTDIKDEDDMLSNSATMLATQQSIKAYVDAQVDTVDTLSEVLAIGNTSGSTDVNMDAAQKVQFRDAAIYINSSVDGQLDIVADTEIQIAATTVDLQGNLGVTGNLDVDGTIEFDALSGTGAVAVTDIKDEDDMSSNSATMLATQQSIKAYVDAQVDTVDTLSEVLAIGNTSGSTDVNMDAAQKVQFRDAAIYINSSVDGQLDIVADTEIQVAATTIDIQGNLGVTGNLDVDGTIEFDALSGTGAVAVTDIKDEDDMASNSATMLATQQSIKAYVDSAAGTDALSAVLAVGNTTGGTDLTISIGDDLTTLTAATGNFRAGAGAGASIASGGNSNTLVGDNAGAANTTGSSNTASGYYALSANTTGSSNTASGYASLQDNTTASNNTAFGYSSLTANTTGNGNTAGGYESLKANTSGSSNTASGYSSLKSNTTGIQNAAVGFQSLLNNTTGSSNVAVGYSALKANTTGISNTAIGYESLKANTTGYENVAVGQMALTANTTGYENTSVGDRTLQACVGGHSNVALGANALKTNIAGSNNVAVGVDALTDSTASGIVAVGHTALANNTTGSSNTALGWQSLVLNTTGANNTATGKDALFRNTTGSSNTASGLQALYNNTTGYQNTASGYLSLTNNTTGFYNAGFGDRALTANTTGTRNTAVGAACLMSNTSGINNTATGVGALLANTTASSNSAFGYNSLTANTTGASNSAFGYKALSANTTGIQNAAVGFQSLLSNTTASANTAIGYNTLANNTTGSNNTAGGNNCLTSNTTGSSLTAYGTQALNANTTGSSNTAHGLNALRANTTGSYNTAVGSATSQNLSTGHYNTSVGQASTSGLTTGSFNTVLGRAAGWSLTTGSQNTLIGYNTQATSASAGIANALGSDVSGAGGYTTLGGGASDIRAAHGSTTWSTVSDERYKKDITDSTAGLDFVNALKPRTWNYRTLGELPETFSAYEEGSTEVFKNTQTNHGFIAQEVKAAIDADSGLKDGFKMWDDRDDGSQEVAEAALIPVLVKAIQELTAQNQELTARIAILEDK